MKAFKPPRTNEDLRSIALSRVWLVFALGIVILANTWPLDLSSPNNWPWRLRSMAFRLPDFGTLASMGVWSVTGVLAAASRLCKPWQLAVSLLAAALGVEMIEVTAEGRHASLIDGLLGGAAGMATAIASLRFIHLIPKLLARITLPVLILLAISPPVLSIVANSRTPFANWADGFPVVLGREARFGRNWNGQIYHAALFSRKLELKDVEELQNLGWGDEKALRRKALGAAIVCTDAETPLSFDACPAAGTDEFIDAVRASGAVGLEVVAAAGAIQQYGWGRVLTMSPDPWRRNFTLGQQGDALYLRVRTPWSGTNGIGQGLTLWPAIFSDTAPHHIVAVYDGRTVSAFVDGEPLPARNVYWPRFEAGHDGPAGDVVIAIAIGFAIGTLSAFLTRGRVIAVMTLLPTVSTLMFLSSTGPAVSFLCALFAVLTSAFGVAFGSALLCTSRRAPE